VSIFEFSKSLGVFFLSLEKIIVPLLVELLVLLDVGLLALFSLLSLVEDELFLSSVIVLQLELGDPVLGHLCLNILAFNLASVSVLFKDLTIGAQKLIKGNLLT
jgi:hypothetical protein